MTEPRLSDLDLYCACGDFVPDASGDAGCGNCGADYSPQDREDARDEWASFLEWQKEMGA